MQSRTQQRGRSKVGFAGGEYLAKAKTMSLTCVVYITSEGVVLVRILANKRSALACKSCIFCLWKHANGDVVGEVRWIGVVRTGVGICCINFLEKRRRALIVLGFCFIGPAGGTPDQGERVLR